MNVYQDLEAMIASPANGSVEVVGLALNVWFAAAYIVSPETDRNSDVIQPSCCDLSEIALSDPVVPVVVQGRLGLAPVLPR